MAYPANPAPLFELLAEDYRTYSPHAWAEPGFHAVAIHRLGVARMSLTKALRAPATAAYLVAEYAVRAVWGIELRWTTQLGRRVRIWHQNCVIGARSIGDDVHLRQYTTIGITSSKTPNEKPVIGSNVNVGAGAIILGGITIGDGARIGAGAVVMRSVPADTTAVGNPARHVGARRHSVPPSA